MEGSHQYLMWMKRKQMLKSHIEAARSWEERAFAEDAARILGGYIWPPRSYSCSFCKREFRSAQALGGHMNVHRRDRARLKQSLISPHHHNTNDSKGSSDSEVITNGREEDFKGFSHGNNNYVETDLSMGLLPSEEAISCKRPKASSISSVPPVFLKPCSNDHKGLVFQSAEMVLGVKPKMEDLDLELRLGEPQKVK